MPQITLRCHGGRSERTCAALAEQEAVTPQVLVYLNRLSDLLFVAARLIAKRQQIGEVLWQAARPEA